LTPKKPYLKVTLAKLGSGVTKVYDSPKWLGWMGDDKAKMDIPWMTMFGE
jgi:hypothetical protein